MFWVQRKYRKSVWFCNDATNTDATNTDIENTIPVDEEYLILYQKNANTFTVPK